LGSSEQLTVAALLSELAADTPAPGGGAAAALAGALAAGLVEMAAGTSRPEHATRAAALRAHVVSLADEDAAAYTRVIDAQRAAARDADRIAAALSAASDVPLAIAEAAAELAELAAELATTGRASLRGDAVAGALLAEAATAAAGRLVEINLADAPADPRAARARDLADRAARARQSALAAG
jgi:formiminotetrahydrofolate cyclodeaminase